MTQTSWFALWGYFGYRDSRSLIASAAGRLGMLPVLRKVSAVIRFDGVDAAEIAATVDFIEQPGATLHIVTRFRIDPDRMQAIAGTEFKGFHPLEDIVTPQSLPAPHIGVTDATLIGVDQVETAMATTAAIKI